MPTMAKSIHLYRQMHVTLFATCLAIFSSSITITPVYCFHATRNHLFTISNTNWRKKSCGSKECTSSSFHPGSGTARGLDSRLHANLSSEKGGFGALIDKIDRDSLSDFCQGTNEFWKSLVIEPVRNYVEIQPAESAVTSTSTPLTRLTSPPEIPGIPRPVWLTILGSVPTGLLWYGYYKFSVEEELYHYEMMETGRVTGCGGYGTLFPFVFGILIGFPLSLLNIPGGELLIEAAGAWILLGQINLYYRVNELCTSNEAIKYEIGIADEPPLYEWWAILPPPLDVVVGLRQVHFLSEYWRVVRGYPKEKDIVADDLFPFISLPERFTLKQFFRRPRYWFWFTSDWEDLNLPFLRD